MWDDTDSNAWSWIALSEDGGSTWTVSVGHPDMRLAGLRSVAATDEAIVLAFTGEGFDAIKTWTLPRHLVPTGRINERSIGPDASDDWGFACPVGDVVLLLVGSVADPATMPRLVLEALPGAASES